MSNDHEIYFHVGLGKVASTYLQARFFPKLQGITYIPTNRYKKSKKIISAQLPSKWLVSREFDRQFDREVKWFTETYPQARIIMLVRPHDSWVASQYRRYVKNGWHYSFDHFLDMKNDEGFWKQSDVPYMPRIKLVEELTGQKPLVLFHHELKETPWEFLGKIASFCGATFEQSAVSLQPFHASYSVKQLLVLRQYCRIYAKKVPKGYSNKLKHWLLYRPVWAYYHLIMYAANFFPKSWVPKEPLIEPELLTEIKSAYHQDWEDIKAYAAKNNPT
ncbi:MAG: hypothetical protein ACI8QD_000157 [Cyclobacteriaceae bacterium]|jgi:hypothetical protein